MCQPLKINSAAPNKDPRLFFVDDSVRTLLESIFKNFLKEFSKFLYIFSFSKNRSGWDGLFRQCLFGLMIYYALASIVHPWYVINLMAVALFTSYRFPFVWSALVVLSYVAYGDQPVQEIPLFLFIEYLLLGSMIVYELFAGWKKRSEVAPGSDSS